MYTIQIFLLGQPRVVPTGSSSPVKFTRSVLSLFAYLLLQPRHPIPREHIIDTFWGEQAESRARSCLNSALWRLRSALKEAALPAQEYVITTEDGRISFNWASAYWLDVERFEQIDAILKISPAAMQPADVQTLETAGACYAGELLEGFYDDWALRERERLRTLYVNGLTQLMHYYAYHNNSLRGLDYGRKILELDPLREEIHRAMIRLYLQMGQRSSAVEQYESCRACLAKELGVEPMEETQLLYAQMMGLTTAVAPVSLAHDLLPEAAVDYQQTLRELKLARKRIDEAGTQIRRTIHLLEQYVHHIDARP